jgi:D-hydroxyproline dehydrogenase subunit gamma
MFRRLPENDPGALGMSFTFDGTRLSARSGDSLACALLAADVLVCRTTPASGAPRAPWCLMGVCFECLVTIDGVANRQACMVQVKEGMRVTRQSGKRDMSPTGPPA